MNFMNELDRDIKGAKEIADALMYIAEVFGENAKQLAEALMIATRTTNDLIMSFEEFATMVNCMEPRRQETKPIYKMCFDRPRIVHQVSNRRPRNLVKKIIH